MPIFRYPVVEGVAQWAWDEFAENSEKFPQATEVAEHGKDAIGAFEFWLIELVSTPVDQAVRVDAVESDFLGKFTLQGLVFEALMFVTTGNPVLGFLTNAAAAIVEKNGLGNRAGGVGWLGCHGISGGSGDGDQVGAGENAGRAGF